MSLTRTFNGALSHHSDSNRVSTFFRVTRETPDEERDRYLTGSWTESPLDTLKLIALTRNCRGGKGEKKQGIGGWKWLNEHSPKTFSINAKHIPEYGSWKDMLSFMLTDDNTTPYSAESQVVSIFCAQLDCDWKLYQAKKFTELSLAFKWAPSEKGHHQKHYNATSKFCKVLGLTAQQYRKRCSKVRAALNVVEQKICAGKWDDIDFSKVPSCAMALYTNAFKNHTPDRYQEFLNKVKVGETKMNTGQLQPYQIIGPYIKNTGCRSVTGSVDDSVEVRWSEYLRQLTDKLNASGSKMNFLPMIDVSGSMINGRSSVTPLSVAISLGITFSSLANGRFKDKWITFTSTPKLSTLQGDTLHSKIDNVFKDASDWCQSTNFEAAFDLILNTAITFGLTQNQLPEAVVVISDMQFDAASRNSNRERTNDQAIVDKWQTAGLTPPKRIYWNVAAANCDFPVISSALDTALISGFDPCIIKLFTDGIDISPYSIMKLAICDKAYDKLTIHPDDEPKLTLEEIEIIGLQKRIDHLRGFFKGHVE